METKMTQKTAVIAGSDTVMNPAQRLLTHTVKIADPASVSNTPLHGKKMVLLRQVIGEELRRRRNEQSLTLRDVSRDAQVSLGYLSEVERGQKEASSELLNSICQALDLSLLAVMTDVSIAIRATEAPSLSVVEAAA